jgi:PAS domain S-box-containing protein
MLDLATKSRLIELKQRQESLPETMSEALADSRPIVVTSAAFPFDVVDVNQAWVGLCEYTREEAVNRNLDDLLQGPETSAEVARDMISRLKRDQYSEAYLTNYTKSGRKFQNHVKVGLISGDDGTGKFYVGILEEIQSQESGNVSMKE